MRETETLASTIPEADRRSHLHPFTSAAEHAETPPRVIVEGAGIHVRDAAGREYLDGMSGLWCVNAGYGRNELIDAAAAQMRNLPYYNNFFQCASPPSIELAAIISEVSQPQLDHVFFSGSGSESNDTIVRMVRRYWDLMGQPERHTIISRKNAYHGSTVAAASLGGMKPMHRQKIGRAHV